MNEFTDGLIFGLIDNAVLIAGSFTGLAVEKFLPFKTVGIGAVIGAGIGNAVSDLLGGLAIDPVFGLGTFVGCLLGLIFIPIFTATKHQPE
jgi:hypothetical protein